MSDSSQGPGWWQASDGKWYPPDQAPGFQQPAPSPYGAPQGGGPSGGTDVGSVLSYAWNKFVQNIGEWVLLWLIVVGITILIGIVLFVLGVGGGMAGSFSGSGFSGLGLVLGFISSLVSGVLFVVLCKGGAQAVNGQRIDIAAAFQLTGNNITAGLIFGGLIGIANLIPCVGIFLVLLVYALVGFLPVMSALYDRGADGLSEAVQLSTSKPGEAMLFWLIGAIITSCCFFLGAPIAAIGGAYLVKAYRGETSAP